MRLSAINKSLVESFCKHITEYVDSGGFEKDRPGLVKDPDMLTAADLTTSTNRAARGAEDKRGDSGL